MRLSSTAPPPSDVAAPRHLAKPGLASGRGHDDDELVVNPPTPCQLIGKHPPAPKQIWPASNKRWRALRVGGRKPRFVLSNADPTRISVTAKERAGARGCRSLVATKHTHTQQQHTRAFARLYTPGGEVGSRLGGGLYGGNGGLSFVFSLI